MSALWSAHLYFQDVDGVYHAAGVATGVDKVFEGCWEISLRQSNFLWTIPADKAFAGGSGLIAFAGRRTVVDGTAGATGSAGDGGAIFEAVAGFVSAGAASAPFGAEEFIFAPGVGHEAAVTGCEAGVSGVHDAGVDAVGFAKTLVRGQSVGAFIAVNMLRVTAGFAHKAVHSAGRQSAGCNLLSLCLRGLHAGNAAGGQKGNDQTGQLF